MQPRLAGFSCGIRVAGHGSMEMLCVHVTSNSPNNRVLSKSGILNKPPLEILIGYPTMGKVQGIGRFKVFLIKDIVRVGVLKYRNYFSLLN